MLDPGSSVLTAESGSADTIPLRRLAIPSPFRPAWPGPRMMGRVRWPRTGLALATNLWLPPRADAWRAQSGDESCGAPMTATSAAPGRLNDHYDPIPGTDLADPDPARTPELDHLFAELRREHAVFWQSPKSHPGFWSVIRYAEAVQVYRDSATFSAAHGMTLDSLRPDLDPASG